jgi:hypothetical protein
MILKIPLLFFAAHSVFANDREFKNPATNHKLDQLLLVNARYPPIKSGLDVPESEQPKED